MAAETLLTSIRRRRMLVVSVLAVSGVLAGTFIHYRAFSKKKERLQSLAAQLALATRKAVSDVTPTADDDTAHAELRDLAERVPAGADVGGLLQELSAAFAVGNLSDREVTTQSTVVGRPFSRIPLSLRLTCSFDQVFNLLGRIEQSERVIRVDRLAIENSGSDGAKKLRVEIDLSTFARDPEETAAWAGLE